MAKTIYLTEREARYITMTLGAYDQPDYARSLARIIEQRLRDAGTFEDENKNCSFGPKVP